MIKRKKNIAGYIDEVGRFRPIRKPSYVGTPKRRATKKDRKKYSRAKAGDLGVAAQEKATGVDFFARQSGKEKKAGDRTLRRIERETLGEADEMDRGRTLVEFVRDKGGIRPTYKFGGKANRGKKISYDHGELAGLTYKESGKRGLVSEKGKLTLDGMHQAAREAGYDIGDTWDLIKRLDDEIRGGKVTYATRGYIDYRENPGKSDLYVAQLGSRSFGVFLKTYLLKKFSTKAAANSHVRSIRTKAKKNPINIFGVVAAVSGVQSALQINEMLKKKPTRRKASGKRNPSGKTKAKRKNATSKTLSGAKYNEQLFDRDLAQIEDGNFRVVRSAKLHGKLAGYRATEIEQRIQRARLAFRLKEMYRSKENPASIAAELKRLQAATKLLASRRKNGGRSIKRNPVGWFREVSPVTAEAIKKLYRTLAAKYHPDKGGDTRTMQEINADYDKAMKIAISGEGNEARAKAETQAIKPLREAIEFAVTLPDDVRVVIRGLWLWIEGNTYKAKDQIKAFKSSDGKRFKWASQKKAWFFAAVPSSNRRGEMSFSEIEALHGRQDIRERKQRRALNPKKVPKRNAAKTKLPRSRTFETFQGRPVTNATRRPVSRHAPAKVAQLGDLIEIKLVGMTPIKLNPASTKLCAANGRLWIVGKRFAKASNAAKANEINPIGEIDHVVYRTHKPHHGDAPGTHYIHKLGEETGQRPLLCVDKEGFPVIRGGAYKIEARGIVN
jgi:hypothetical protein